MVAAPSGGTVTPWEIDTTQAGLVQFDYYYNKNNPVGGSPSEYFFYFKIQNINEFELNTFNVSTTAGPAPGSDGGWGVFPNIGVYPNSFNSSEQGVGYPVGSTMRIQIRRAGTVEVIHDFTLDPFPNGLKERTPVYIRPTA